MNLVIVISPSDGTGRLWFLLLHSGEADRALASRQYSVLSVAFLLYKSLISYYIACPYRHPIGIRDERILHFFSIRYLPFTIKSLRFPCADAVTARLYFSATFETHNGDLAESTCEGSFVIRGLEPRPYSRHRAE